MCAGEPCLPENHDGRSVDEEQNGKELTWREGGEEGPGHLGLLEGARLDPANNRKPRRMLILGRPCAVLVHPFPGSPERAVQGFFTPGQI